MKQVIQMNQPFPQHSQPHVQFSRRKLRNQATGQTRIRGKIPIHRTQFLSTGQWFISTSSGPKMTRRICGQELEQRTRRHCSVLQEGNWSFGNDASSVMDAYHQRYSQQAFSSYPATHPSRSDKVHRPQSSTTQFELTIAAKC